MAAAVLVGEVHRGASVGARWGAWGAVGPAAALVPGEEAVSSSHHFPATNTRMCGDHSTGVLPLHYKCRTKLLDFPG